MQPRGALMKEHRLIERMIGRIEKEAGNIRRTRAVDPSFIYKAADFIQIYADRTHHGKEEDILFREVEGKQMKEEDRGLMNELLREHVFGRKTTAGLLDATKRYEQGDEDAMDEVLEKLEALIELYQGHIEKEDKVFFPATMNYLSSQEQDHMLKEFDEFDKSMIHKKYKDVIEHLSE